MDYNVIHKVAENLLYHCLLLTKNDAGGGWIHSHDQSNKAHVV